MLGIWTCKQVLTTKAHKTGTLVLMNNEVLINMALTTKQEPEEKISPVLTQGLRAGIDCRRIQMFGITSEALNSFIPKTIVSTKQLPERTFKIKDLPTRIVVRRGAIDNFLEAIDRSCFDVAMFFEGDDQVFDTLNKARISLRMNIKDNLNKTINEQASEALKEGLTLEKQLAAQHQHSSSSSSCLTQDDEAILDSDDCPPPKAKKCTLTTSTITTKQEATPSKAHIKYGRTSYICSD